MIIQRIAEFLWPPLRLKRIEQEWDADERLQIAKMNLEWMRYQAKIDHEELLKPFAFRKYIKKKIRDDIRNRLRIEKTESS